MKRRFYLTAVLAGTSFLAFAAAAAESDNNSRARQAQQSGRDAVRMGQTVKASDVLGKDVHNRQNEDLGDLKDVAIDVESGRIVHAIISTGGLGGRTIAVPPK